MCKSIDIKHGPFASIDRVSFWIENGLAIEAHAALDAALDLLGSTGPKSLAHRRYRCVTAISQSMRGAHRAGVPTEILLGDFFTLLEEFAHLRSWQAVRRRLHQYVGKLLTLVNPDKRTEIEKFVRWMRSDMTHDVANPRTLHRYAEIAGISHFHLSRCFRSIVGCTFREEQRRIRLNRARQLLEETELKIQAIACRVGFADPSQFCAEFRRRTRLTPGAYRRQHRRMNSIDAG
jgi:AraC-like DNA-binding protein